MGQGWICLHRKIRDCEMIWDDKPFSRGQAWIDLLLMANHEEKEILFNGSYRKIERGEMLTSLTKLSDQWGWSRKKTTKFLNELKMAQMLDFKSDNKSTAITIVNYSVYQDLGTAKEPQKNRKRTAEEHQRNTNNNDITTNNNENNRTPLPPLGENNSPEYDFDKHSNKENAKHILNNGLFSEWEYIKANSDLWEIIKAWMEYKDAKKPRSTNHYVNERSICTLLGKFVSSSKAYGVDAVVKIVDDSMGQGYTGIVWNWLEKKKISTGTDWSNIH